MGYTHYWRRRPEISQGVFDAIRQDFETLLPVFAENGIQLGNGHGRETPVINSDEITFNGLENCGHPKNTDIVIPWPTKGARGVGSNEDAVDGSWFAGASLQHRACNGDCSYETMTIERVFTPQSWEKPDENGLYFAFCKTAFRPYDVAVTALLLILKHHLKDDCTVSTDGDEDGWMDAVLLCNKHLGGYALDEFSVAAGEVSLSTAKAV